MPRVFCTLDIVTQRVIYYKKLRNAFSVMVPRRGEYYGSEASSSGFS